MERIGHFLNSSLLSRPLDNPLSEPESETGHGMTSGAASVPEAVLPDIFRGRMFCVRHGRQCYRGRNHAGENVWICPDERHSNPLIG